MQIDPPPQDLDLRRLRALYRALGDATRLRILGLLGEVGPMNVNELSSRILLSQPLISWHLRILRVAGFIETQRQGREVVCRLRPAAFAELHIAEEQLLRGDTAAKVSRTSLAADREEVPDVG